MHVALGPTVVLTPEFIEFEEVMPVQLSKLSKSFDKIMKLNFVQLFFGSTIPTAKVLLTRGVITG